MTAGGRGASRVVSWSAAAAFVLAAAFLVLGQHAFRDIEAWFSASILRVTQIFPARAIGVAVIFPVRGALVGLSISASCTAALLISPFLLLSGGLVASGRVSVGRGVSTAAVLALILFVVNQARILVIALSMRWWGFERGYEISHILLGTIVSTLGVLAGLLIFTRVLVRGRVIGAVDG